MAKNKKVVETPLTKALRAALFGRANRRISSEAHEKAIIAAAKAGSSEALLELIYAYGGSLRMLVGRRYGNQYAGHPDYRPDAPIDNDLYSACTDALLVAIKQFDPAKHHRLAATLTMRSAARKAVDTTLSITERNLAAVRVPYGTMTVYNWLRSRAEADILAETGHCPQSNREINVRAAQIADADPKVSLSGDAVMNIGRLLEGGNVVSLSADPDEDEDGYEKAPLREEIEAPEAVIPFVEAENKLLAQQAMAVLPEDELEIVQYAYGFPPKAYRALSDGEICEEKEIKENYGYSRSKVCRMRNKALDRMRTELHVNDPE